MNSLLDKNKVVARRASQDNEVGLTFNRPTRRKQVSYNIYEGYLQDIENKLMKQYRCGYSTLMKKLVRERAEEISSKNFWKS